MGNNRRAIEAGLAQRGYVELSVGVGLGAVDAALKLERDGLARVIRNSVGEPVGVTRVGDTT